VVCYVCGTFSLALLALVPTPHGGGEGGGKDPRKVCCSVLQCVAVCGNGMLYARDVLSCNALRYSPFRLRKQTKKERDLENTALILSACVSSRVA